MRKLLIVLVALLAAGAAFGVSLLAPVNRGVPAQVGFTVSPGDNLRDVSEQLARLGLIRSRTAFTLLGRIRGDSRRIKAGPYRAGTDEWAWEILDRMVGGTVLDTTITVPEGLWLTEVSRVVGPLLEGGAEAFLEAAQDSALLSELGVEAPTAEGYLFPSTYRMTPGGTAEALVRHMVETFWDCWNRELAARAEASTLGTGEIVTLASIVEAEARLPEERPRIAAVYLNRLVQDHPLQADPTVLYGLGVRKPRTLYADLESDSPYNTYRVTGLPPGPIGNPGLDALRAVLWPDPDCRDLYFVARGDGSHLFGRTYREHQENRRQVLRERREAGMGDP